MEKPEISEHLKDEWKSMLRSGKYRQCASKDQAQPYCVLGVLANLEEKPVKRRRIRSTIRRYRKRFGVWFGSKIAGYDITPASWDEW